MEYVTDSCSRRSAAISVEACALWVSYVCPFRVPPLQTLVAIDRGPLYAPRSFSVSWRTAHSLHASYPSLSASFCDSSRFLSHQHHLRHHHPLSIGINKMALLICKDKPGVEGHLIQQNEDGV